MDAVKMAVVDADGVRVDIWWVYGCAGVDKET